MDPTSNTAMLLTVVLGILMTLILAFYVIISLIRPKTRDFVELAFLFAIYPAFQSVLDGFFFDKRTEEILLLVLGASVFAAVAFDIGFNWMRWKRAVKYHRTHFTRLKLLLKTISAAVLLLLGPFWLKMFF